MAYVKPPNVPAHRQYGAGVSALSSVPSDSACCPYLFTTITDLARRSPLSATVPLTITNAPATG